MRSILIILIVLAVSFVSKALPNNLEKIDNNIQEITACFDKIIKEIIDKHKYNTIVKWGWRGIARGEDMVYLLYCQVKEPAKEPIYYYWRFSLKN